jgi:hypothetical protein
VPATDTGTGILGKWKYIPNLDVLMGLQDSTLGNVWVYKPAGWTNPKDVPPPPSPPSAPTGVSASDGASTNSVTVNWNASADASGYTIYRSSAAGTQGSSIGSATSTSFTDATPTPGVTYYYSVAAIGAGGSSSASVQDSGYAAAPAPPAPPVPPAPPASPPDAPTGVNASDGTSTSSITVNWNASANASNYTIYRSSTPGTPGSSVGTSSTTSFTDSTPVPGSTYYYGVTATGPSGTSALSTQDSGNAAAAQVIPAASSEGDGGGGGGGCTVNSRSTPDWTLLLMLAATGLHRLRKRRLMRS